MNYLTDNKKNILIHLLFLFILSLYYLIPYFLVGQLIVNHTIFWTQVWSKAILLEGF